MPPGREKCRRAHTRVRETILIVANTGDANNNNNNNTDLIESRVGETTPNSPRRGYLLYFYVAIAATLTQCSPYSVVRGAIEHV